MIIEQQNLGAVEDIPRAFADNALNIFFMAGVFLLIIELKERWGK